jgi:DNA-binding beta-propeller fold protein YncE
VLIAAGSVRDISVHAFKLCGLTWCGEYLWFSEAVTNQISAVDPHTREVTRRIPCADVRADLTTAGGHLLQVVGDAMTLRVIDSDTGATIDELQSPRLGHALCGLEAARDGVWMGFDDLGVIDLRGTDGFRLLDSIPIAHPPAGIAVSDRYLFYADHHRGIINVIDFVRRKEIAAIDVDGNPTGITWDGSRIWYCDDTTLQLRAIEVPGIIAGEAG